MEDRLNQICWKIIKNKHIQNDIVKIITNIFLSDKEKFISIYNIVINNKDINNNHNTNNENDKTYIGDRLLSYIDTKYQINNDTVIADIGGGNGNLLAHFANKKCISKEKLYCIESKNDWYEPYTFSHNSISYILWDSLSSFNSILNNSVDIVIIMVALHHMSDKTINILFNNLNHITKSGSLLIIKEHNCQKYYDIDVINWEHHFYHMVKSKHILSTNDINNYFDNIYINNFKSKIEYDKIIESYGYIKINELNRLLEYSSDFRNPTNLYWSIYQKL